MAIDRWRWIGVKMEKVTDYLQLWRELAEAHARGRQAHPTCREDVWKHKAQGFEDGIRKRWEKSDSSRAWVLELLRTHPGSSFLDIGAGTGAWACLVAPHCRKVTAVEPSPAMVEIMERNIAGAGCGNIVIVQKEWPFDPGETYDITLSSHSIYGTLDFREYIEAMVRVTANTCVLLLRAPMNEGVMAEIATTIWGHPYDSTNFQVGYNALLQMGIFPDVMMEDSGLWEPWINASVEEAVQDVKRKMGLTETDRFDGYLHDLLTRRLEQRGDRFVWPRGNRSALLHWEPRRIQE